MCSPGLPSLSRVKRAPKGLSIGPLQEQSWLSAAYTVRGPTSEWPGLLSPWTAEDTHGCGQFGCLGVRSSTHRTTYRRPAAYNTGKGSSHGVVRVTRPDRHKPEWDTHGTGTALGAPFQMLRRDRVRRCREGAELLEG